MCARNYSASENADSQSTFALVSFHTRHFRCFMWQYHHMAQYHARLGVKCNTMQY